MSESILFVSVSTIQGARIFAKYDLRKPLCIIDFENLIPIQVE